MVRRMTEADMIRFAGDLGMRLDESEVAQYRELSDDLLGLLEGVETPDAPPPAERAVIGRATPQDDPLNAVVHWIDVAGEAEGPLAGQAVALKDSVAVAGVPLTCGSRLLRDFVPGTDATVTKRLLAAGARLVAMTNMDDLALSGGGDSSWYGPVRNPFDPTRTAGGSSGGTAAVLRYPGVDASIGTDQGGSIRLPAAWCGVVGLKPTHGLVPYTGVAGMDHSLDHVGPLARTVTDLAEVLAVIAGLDGRDPRQPREVPTADYRAAVREAPDDLRGVTVGVLTQALSTHVPADPEVVAAVHETVERLRALGAVVRDVDLPEHLENGPVANGTFVEGMSGLLAGGGNGYQWHGRYWPELARAIAQAMPDAVDELSPQTKIIMLVGEYLRREYRGEYYARAQNLRPRLVAAHDRALAGVDVLLAPTSPLLPHKVVDGLSPREFVLRGWAPLANTAPTDSTGHPAISLPLAEATTEDGPLPVGIMLVGRRFGEAGLLRIARTCERALGWRPDVPDKVAAGAGVPT
jgi:amidase